MFLGVSIGLLIACGILGARLLGLRTFWERLLAAPVLSLALLILCSLTVGLIPGGYRPIPLLVTLSFAFLGLLAAAARTGRVLPFRGLTGEDKPYVWAGAAVAVLTLPVWGWKLFNGLLLPPIYWDELYYHLVAPAVWARVGAVHFFPTSNLFVAGYPANLGLVPGWSMVMTGTDVWADLTGFPFLFLGLAVVIAFCRQLDVRPWHSFWAGMLFVTTPMVLYHAKSAYIDLPLSVLFGAASYFLFLFAKEGHRAQLVAGAVTMGIIVGAKFSGPYMAIAGLLPIWYQRFAGTRLRKLRWTDLALYYLVPIVVLGGFFYGRNMVMFGNPLYPMTLKLGGVTIFAGKYAANAFNFTTAENTWTTLGKALVETDPYPTFDSFHSGFGPQLLLLGIPAILIFLLCEPGRRRLVLIAWLAPLLLSVVTLPAKYPRYLVHLSLFLFPFVGWLMDRLARVPGRAVKLVALACAGYSVLIATPIGTVLPFEYETAARSEWTVTQVGWGAHYAYVDTLSRAKGGPLRVVTGTLRMTYPLLGPRWQNELISVPAVNEAQWVAGVVEARADVVAIDNTGEPAPEKVWVNRHPEVFRRLFDDTVVSAYMVLPGDQAHRGMVRALEQGGWSR